jgi:gamma-glutamylcyclotransferase (GGCT)/AIG2-like uncharacterized protein YtfP
MPHLFTYGTLMFPEVWRVVVAKNFETTPAQLPGYEIFRVAGALYPGIIAIDPSPAEWERLGEGATEPAELARKKGEGGSHQLAPQFSALSPQPDFSSPSGPRPSTLDSRLSPVPGLLYHDVDPASLARLDAFEEDFYLRQSITVTCEDGRALAAQAYVVPENRRDVLTKEIWTAADFAARGDLARFVAKYSGFNRLNTQ